MTDKYIKAIQDQEVTWRDLGYNSFLHRERLRGNVNVLNADTFNTLLDDGSIDTTKLGSLILGSFIESLDAGKITSGFISSDVIAAGSITSEKLTIGSLQFTSTIVWTATDADTATWVAGTLKFSDGDSYAIDGGNTGNIAGTTYIYLDTAVSSTVLQTTTTAANAVGANKRLVAIVTAGATGSKCVIDVQSGVGTTISGSKITTGKIQSSDGKTYFDLDGDQIIINDATNDRILIGYQSGGF